MASNSVTFHDHECVKSIQGSFDRPVQVSIPSYSGEYDLEFSPPCHSILTWMQTVNQTKIPLIMNSNCTVNLPKIESSVLFHVMSGTVLRKIHFQRHYAIKNTYHVRMNESRNLVYHDLEFDSIPSLPCCPGYTMSHSLNTSYCDYPLGPVTYSRIFTEEELTARVIPGIPCLSDDLPVHLTQSLTLATPATVAITDVSLSFMVNLYGLTLGYLGILLFLFIQVEKYRLKPKYVTDEKKTT